ncbi:ABATE domain-containing protein [Streptomyces sp. HPF1205]|uniref:CGNR zinc finger domain-containing protein n=1 Tax=Streptomyces sp. HPF1205 TaxID=2873262 RepID=UPI001CEC61C4|nr:ABATE domain-containing protein [Streptomyces sp. HPF1205]
MRFDSGRVSLDLVATRAGRHPVEEELTGPEALGAWIRGAGLVPAGTALAVDAGWLPPFTRLRDVVRRMVTAELAGRGQDPADVAALNDAARPAPPALCALLAAGGALTRGLATPPTREALLAAVARDAVELFTDPPARSQLRRCAGENCTLVYLDTSRGRRRRWCSSEVCGNRERVARHRRRTTLSTPRG